MSCCSPAGSRAGRSSTTSRPRHVQGTDSRLATARFPVGGVQVRPEGRVVAPVRSCSETLTTRGLSPLATHPGCRWTEVRRFETRADEPDQGPLRSVDGRRGQRAAAPFRRVCQRHAERLTLDRPADLLGCDPDRSDGPSMRRLLQARDPPARVRPSGRRPGSTAHCWRVSVAVRIDPPSGRPAKASESISRGHPRCLLYDPLVPTSPDGVVAGHVVLRRLRTSLRAIAPGATTFLSLSRRDAALHASLVSAGAVQLETGRVRDITDKVSNGDGVSEQLAIAWPKRVVILGVTFVGTAIHDVMPFAREAAELVPA